MNASVARRIAFTAIALTAAVFVTATGSPVQAAAVQIVSPAPEEILPGPDVPVQVVTEGIQFVPGGCNLHIILDDGPFAVQYDPAHPYLLRDVAPGSHTLRVFAADRLHRALPGTLSVVTFSVGYQDEFNRPSPGYPLLTVNLPQGEYLGVDAGDVAIDFLVDGACLSRRGYHVAYYVDGRKFYAYSEGERHLKGLPPGFHTVRFELLNEFGEPVPGRFNSWEKVILLSPHKTRRIPTEEDVRRGMPLIESFKGAMTNGQPWVAGNPAPIPLPRATPAVIPGAGLPADAAGPVVGTGTGVSTTNGFAVRPGGRRVGPAPDAEELSVLPGASAVEPPVGAGPGPAVSDDLEVIDTAPVAGAAVPAVVAAPTPVPAAVAEALTVAAPTVTTTTSTRTTTTGRKPVAVERRESEEDTTGPNGGGRTGTSGAAGARNGDNATTSSRDLRPQAFRRYDPPTTRTVTADSPATRTIARNTSTTGTRNTSARAAAASATPVAAAVSAATGTSSDSAGGTVRAARAGRSDRENRGNRENRDSRENRRDRRREGRTAESETGNAVPDAANQLPEPGTSNGRVGP